MKWKCFLPSTNFPTSAHDPSAVDPLAQAFYFHGSCPLQRWLKANHIFAAKTPKRARPMHCDNQKIYQISLFACWRSRVLFHQLFIYETFCNRVTVMRCFKNNSGARTLKFERSPQNIENDSEPFALLCESVPAIFRDVIQCWIFKRSSEKGLATDRREKSSAESKPRWRSLCRSWWYRLRFLLCSGVHRVFEHSWTMPRKSLGVHEGPFANSQNNQLELCSKSCRRTVLNLYAR